MQNDIMNEKCERINKELRLSCDDELERITTLLDAVIMLTILEELKSLVESVIACCHKAANDISVSIDVLAD
jgi:predicted ATPase